MAEPGSWSSPGTRVRGCRPLAELQQQRLAAPASFVPTPLLLGQDGQRWPRCTPRGPVELAHGAHINLRPPPASTCDILRLLSNLLSSTLLNDPTTLLLQNPPSGTVSGLGLCCWQL